MSTSQEPQDGWAWFEPALVAEPVSLESELNRAFARCFAGADGVTVLEYLRRCFLDRRLPPSTSDAELRQVEGQRAVVAQIMALIERGRA